MEGEYGPGGCGVFTEKAKVELDTIVNNTRQVTDNQVDFRYLAGPGLVSLLQHDGQNTLGNTELVHPG